MKKRIIAVVMMVVMLMSTMSSAVFGAEESDTKTTVIGEFLEVDGQVQFVLSLDGNVTEFAYTVDVGEGVVASDGSLSCEFSQEFKDFANDNDGILECGEQNTSKVVFGGVFAEEQSYTGVIGSVKGMSAMETGTVFAVYSGEEKVGEYIYTSVALGDVDDSGAIEAKDALEVLKYTVKLCIPNETQLAAADVDGDGAIAAVDALWILKKVVKLIDKFPAEEA